MQKKNGDDVWNIKIRSQINKNENIYHNPNWIKSNNKLHLEISHAAIFLRFQNGIFLTRVDGDNLNVSKLNG